MEPLHLALRFRRYDLDNQTPRLTFPGYVSWDRTWSDGARINVPYGYTNAGSTRARTTTSASW